ncbi:MAG: diaminopimelate decarboxylase [Propionibacteriaceae bacterium]|jgi:diaminopimelate decarboxylase|nr:diaminopimelate decarboxylase [Propionibacteriaceae bacterium]
MDSSAPAWLTPPADVNALDPAIWPASVHRDGAGELVIAGHTATELVTQFGSPLYLIDEDDFRARARGFATAFAGWHVAYAGKAFLSRHVARWVDEAGLGLDVCSGNELAVALAAGFPPARITLHGNNKSLTELAAAIEAPVGQIVVDCGEEIDRIEALAAARHQTVNVLVRVTPGVEANTHEYIATAVEDQKFGFSIHSGRALEALLRCHGEPHMNLTGIHLHIGSQVFDTQAYALAAKRAIDLLAAFRDATGVELTTLNLGGGFGIAYTAADDPLGADRQAAGLAPVIEANRLAAGLGPLTLAIEPGRAICGPGSLALYTVGVVKPIELDDGTTRTYVAVDGGMSDNPRTALYHAEYTAVLANRSSTSTPALARVVGKHCESGDILVHDVYLGADVRPGDLVAVPGALAYARSLASNYNHATKPAVVAVGERGAHLVLRRETLADLLALDVDPGARDDRGTAGKEG